MKFGIVGGGAAGLYCAWRILQQDPSSEVMLFEKTPRIGGRIYTKYFKGAKLELGAGRLSDNHKLLLSLCQHFKLNLIKIGNKTTYFKDGKKQYLDMNGVIKHIIDKSKSFDTSYLKSITLDMFVRSNRIIASSEIDDLIYAFGYHGDFENCNAHDAIEAMKHDKGSDNQYYIINGGMTKITKCLTNDIKKMGGKINVNTGVLQWDGLNTLTFFDGSQQSFDKIFFCLPKAGLKAISVDVYDKDLEKCLRTVNECPLIRVFAKYDKIWFDFMKETGKVTMNSTLRHIIPINFDDGVAMIVYADEKFASFWHNIEEKYGKIGIINEIEKQIGYVWKNAPRASWIYTKYWDCGVHLWGVNPFKYSNKPGSAHFVCGESVAHHHKCWVEGALESAHEAIQKCFATTK
jgi:monoamine oxidase